MNWYYVQDGNQAGPVTQEQLEELVRTGKVQPQTLVWREGMANWQPYGEVGGGALKMSAAPAAATGTAANPETVAAFSGEQAVCAECGLLFNKQDMINYGTVQVCAGCKPAFVQKLAEGAKIKTGAMHYAGFWIRFAAKFIDGLIMGVVLVVPFFLLVFRSIQTGGGGPAGQPSIGLQLLIQAGFYAVSAAYTIFFLGRYGATPGKMALKLQVVRSDGSKITYLRATGRFFAEILSGMVCYIGYIIAGFDDQKRSLHDHICDTRVIYKH